MDGERDRSPLSRPSELPRLTGRTLWLARAAWVAFAALGLTLFAISLPATLISRGAPSAPIQAGFVQLGMSPSFYAACYLAFSIILAVVTFGIGALVAWRKSD